MPGSSPGPLAAEPARRAEYPRAAASAGGVRGRRPMPVAPGQSLAALAAALHAVTPTWRVLKFRLRRARALQPLANAHGAAVTVLCSPTRSRARATRPPAGLTAAPQSPLRVRPSPDARQGHWCQLAVACKWAGRGPGPPSTGAESKKRSGLRPELAPDCNLELLVFLPRTRTKERASSCRLHLHP